MLTQKCSTLLCPSFWLELQWMTNPSRHGEEVGAWEGFKGPQQESQRIFYCTVDLHERCASERELTLNYNVLLMIGATKDLFIVGAVITSSFNTGHENEYVPTTIYCSSLSTSPCDCSGACLQFIFWCCASRKPRNHNNVLLLQLTKQQQQ